MADGGLWLDEEPDGDPARTSPWRRWAVVGTVAVVLTAVAVPVALMAGGPHRSDASRTTARKPRLDHGPAEHAVLAALSATTDTGSFDFSYTIHSTPATGTATTPTTVCQQQLVPVPSGSTSIGSGTNGAGVITPSVAAATAVGASAAGSGSGDTGTGAGAPPPGMTWRSEKVCTGTAVPPDPVVQGGGIINTNPLAMVASADIGGGLDVTVRVNDASVYEEGSNDTGLAPQPSDAPGSGNSLPQFAGITEGTLGSREGAVAMMGMASPTGYLDLIAPAITAAGETGTGTVGGVAVTTTRSPTISASWLVRRGRRQRNPRPYRPHSTSSTLRATRRMMWLSRSTGPASSDRFDPPMCLATAAPSPWKPCSRTSGVPGPSSCPARPALVCHPWAVRLPPGRQRRPPHRRPRGHAPTPTSPQLHSPILLDHQPAQSRSDAFADDHDHAERYEGRPHAVDDEAVDLHFDLVTVGRLIRQPDPPAADRSGDRRATRRPGVR